KDGVHWSIMAYGVSQDGRYLSYLVAPGGSELGEIRVMEIATRRDLGERLPRVRWNGGNWLPDNRSLVYWRQRKPEPGEPASEAMRFTCSFWTAASTSWCAWTTRRTRAVTSRCPTTARSSTAAATSASPGSSSA